MARRLQSARADANGWAGQLGWGRRTDGRTDGHEERETQTRIRVASQQLPRHREGGSQTAPHSAAVDGRGGRRRRTIRQSSVSPTNDGIKKEGVPTLAYAYKSRSHSYMGPECPVLAGPRACQQEVEDKCLSIQSVQCTLSRYAAKSQTTNRFV